MINVNKKLVIWVAGCVVLLAVIVGGIIWTLDYLSWRPVTFNLSSETKSITVYPSGNSLQDEYSDTTQAIGELDKTGTLRVKPGVYVVIPEGDKIATDYIEVTIADDTKEITINPYYSSEYLAEKFSDHTSSIHTLIKQRYEPVTNNYGVDTGAFYHFGDWYTTFLYKQPAGYDDSDKYGVILHKEGEEWKIVTTPEIVFKYSDYENIPRDIIDAANKNTSWANVVN